MTRITLAGPALEGFTSLGFDDHVKMFFPAPGESRPSLPHIGPEGMELREDQPKPITRDYTLRVDDVDGKAPVLSVFGGKITTYRRLAEHALERLAPYFPAMKPAWTGQAALPGSNYLEREAAKRELWQRYPQLAPNVLQGVFRRHGTLAPEVLGDGRLGEYYGAGLTECEVAYLREREWARTSEDVLWRRTKCGLRMTAAQRARVAQVLGR